MANLQHKIHNNKIKNIKKKIICLGSSIFFLTNQMLPVALASPSSNIDSKLFSSASTEEIQTVRKYFTENKTDDFVPMNLLSKGYDLTEYEMLLVSELVKKDVSSKINNENEKIDAIKDILNFQTNHEEEYKEIFNGKLPEEIKEANDNIKEGSNYNIKNTIPADSPNTSSYIPEDAQKQTNDFLERLKNSDIPVVRGGESPYANEENVQNNPSLAGLTQNYQNAIDNSQTPEDLVENMSLINIKTAPSVKTSTGDNIFVNKNVQSPVTDFANSEDNNVLSNYQNNSNGSSKFLKTDQIDDWDADILNDIINAQLMQEEKKAKHFYLTMQHDIYFVDQHGEGNVPLDMTNLDDNGRAYQSSITNQYQLEETLNIGLGVRVHKALDLIVGLVAKNEDGALFKEGTKWEFGNVLFKFHPERLNPVEAKKLNSEGIVIKDGGKYVGKQLGHETSIGTDTTNGDTSVRAGDAILNYSQEDGFEFANKGSKYYIGFGKLSLNLSSYTLQLSDCKAVEVGYHDNNESFILLYGKPKSEKEGTTSETGAPIKGVYPSKLFAAQYATNKLLPNVALSFNFAQAKDYGTLNNPNGATHGKTTVYSIAFKSNNQTNTSFEGEIARSINNYNVDNPNSKRVTANADYLDLAHKFSQRLSGNLHLVNIDGNYDAGSLVQDKTGEYLLTTNTGDGLADFLYKTGQRGMDLTLNYVFPENASLAFGYTRYSQTTEGNSKTGIFLSGNKTWTLTNDYGDSRGEIGVQQRFDYRDVSNKDYVNKVSETTLSYSGTPWEDGEATVEAQRLLDNAKGNESRFDLTVAHHFYPLNRVSITPKIQYQKKKGSEGIEDKDAMDSTTLVNSLTIGYELIPEQVTVNLLVSKEKYDIIESEIDEATGKKIDGEKRNVLGVGLGLVWKPKNIPGLTAGVSYRRDKVDYFTPTVDKSIQDVWEYSLEYSRPISDNIRASISYDYKSARDKLKPIYDDITRTVAIDINASIGKHSSIDIQHSYESEYKPLDGRANRKTRTTVIKMTNKF